MRKSLKRFAAILCAAVTMVSFSGTKVEAAEFTGGYWQSFTVTSYYNNWYNPDKVTIYNRIETVGEEGRDVRARVKYNFSQYTLSMYEAKVRFIYALEAGGVERYDTVVARSFTVNPGSYEFNYMCDLGAYYIAVRPIYRAKLNSMDYAPDVEGMFYIRY